MSDSDRSTDLPEGWSEVPLRKILTSLESGARPRGGVRGIRDGVPSIGGEHLNQFGGFRFGNIKFVPRGFFDRMRRGHIKVGDVLVVKDGATTGKVALVREDFPFKSAVVNEHVFVCSFGPSLHSPFVFYYLFSRDGQERILENFQGSAQGGINQEFAVATRVPIAPLAEQRRIVVEIEELLARVRSANEHLDHVPDILKRFRQSVLAAGCSGQLTKNWRESHAHVGSVVEALKRCRRDNVRTEAGRKLRKRGTPGLAEVALPDDLPKTWVLRKIRDLYADGAIVDFQDGNHGDLYPRRTDFGEAGVTFLTAAQVFNNRVLLTDAPLLSREKASELRIGFARPCDVLLTHNATVGRVAVLPSNCGEVILGTSVTYYRLRSEVIDPEYCSFAMQGPLWQRQLQAVMEQTTRNQVSVKKQAELWLAIPPVAEQRAIAKRMGVLLRLVDSVDESRILSRGKIERLQQSILAKAFGGELVPTEAELARLEGRDYESASVLLERILRERSHHSPSMQATEAVSRRIQRAHPRRSVGNARAPRPTKSS